MTEDDFKTFRGSGNVFADLGLDNPELRQLRAVLAADIVRIMDARKLTVRKAQALTGVAAADFSRIRNARLDRFTVDRLMTILARLDQKVEVRISVTPRPREAANVIATA